MRRPLSHTTAALALAALFAAAARGSAAGAAAGSLEGRAVLAVSVYGDHDLDRGLVARTFGLGAGDPYSGRAAEEGLLRVGELAGVRHVSHRIETDPRADGLFIVLIIDGEPTRSISPLISRNFADRIGVGASLTERNFRGLNERLRLSVLVNGPVILGASWTKPSLAAAAKIGVEISAAYRRYSWPYPSFADLLVDDRIDRLEGSFGVRFNPADALSIYIAPGLEHVDAGEPMLDGQGTGGVPRAPSGLLATAEAGFDLVRLDRDFYPRSGIHAGAAVRSWGIVQDEPPFEMTRATARATAFVPLGRMVLAVRSRGAISEGDVPAYLYEHLGGAATIRGHEFGVFHGENSFLLSGDLRIPLNHGDLSDLGNPMILVSLDLFADTGAAWNGGESLGTERMHSGFGLGLDFIPKEGWLLKAGYAWPMDTDGRWFFDIGTSY
ncbi:MAG: BamA/TamA family outer membrane protein [Candidatus Krumholzibacteria bacterium]|nr:BamA/TamA family outer membrane protein [Candidatus Krumholzibacteria bacterium]